MKNISLLLIAILSVFSLNAQNVGVDQAAPANKLDVNGNLSVGSAYSGTTAAPTNGALIEGQVAIGTSTTLADLTVFQSEGTSIGQNGIALEIGLPIPGAPTYWKIYHSLANLSFAGEMTRVAYIEAGTGNYVQPSDARLKEGVEPLDNVLNNVLRLQPARYHYTSAKTKEVKTLGFLAQEVQEIFPEFVYTGEDGKGCIPNCREKLIFQKKRYKKMSKEEFLAIAAKRYEAIKGLSDHDNFYDYEKEFETIITDMNREMLEKSLSDLPQDRRKKKKSTPATDASS